MLRFPDKKAIAVLLFIGITAFSAPAQPLLRKVLFLGNSYTYFNDLPALTAALAHTSGDSLYFESNTPGGYTLGWQPTAHVTNPVSLAKIKSRHWDFVVLQEQSQIPSIAALRDSCMYPASVALFDSVKSSHPCSRVLFYLTWGRRFGGMQCFTPNYCSPAFSGFSAMQDSITVAYKGIADSLSAWIAPVGEAWRFVLNNTPIVLHVSDNSHPNLHGSYLAACVFYSVLFDKSPAGLPFTAGLPADTALILQEAADSIVFGWAQQWNLHIDEPDAAFHVTTGTDTLYTQNLSSGATDWYWDFGDGNSSTLFEPVHVYGAPGSYTVSLRSCNSCFCDSVAAAVSILPTGLSPEPVRPGPAIQLAGCGDGTFRLLNYSGDGILRLYDIAGREAGTLTIQGGICSGTVRCGGLFLWTLLDGSHEPVARGKFTR